jgi:hypothetical protein
LEHALRALVFGAIGGCASAPHHDYPVLPQPDALTQTLDCGQLDDRILRADAIRWSLRAEGVKPQLPEGWISKLVEPRPQERRALESAERRITGLLELKAQKGCPGRASALARVTDLDILVKLRAVADHPEQDRYSRWTALNERTRLLDGLCDPQAIRAGQSARP